MKDEHEIKEPSTNELAELRQRIVELEASEDQRERAEGLVRTQRDLGLALAAAHGLDETLRLCLQAAIRVSEMDCGGIYLFDGTLGNMDLIFHTGLPLHFVESASHYDADSAQVRLVMTGKPIYTNHQQLGVPLDEMRRKESLQAIAIVPVRHQDRVIACLNVASHVLTEVPDFSCTAIETIATQIGGAIARAQAEEALRRASVSRVLVGQMLRDLQVIGGISEAAMFRAGQELAARVEAKTLPQLLEAFVDMGLGTLKLFEIDEERQRWTFSGDELVGGKAGSIQPTCNYSRGFLCSAVAQTLDGVRVAGAEMECQSMGDALCKFVVQVVGE